MSIDERYIDEVPNWEDIYEKWRVAIQNMDLEFEAGKGSQSPI